MRHQSLHFFFFLALFMFLIMPKTSYCWGFWGHKRINRIAVFTLPSEMLGFYKKHIEYITNHAVDPDKRRYAVKEEGARHFIDIDHYGKYPFDSLPELWKNAKTKYTEDTLQAYGINPWYIETMLYRLTSAFKEGNAINILRYSADLGHYVADAHVPLHTAENYNGQLTNQYGIHGLWESRIPELSGEQYDYFVGKARYIERPINEAWGFIKVSHAEVDSVLLMEEVLNSETPEDKKYSIEQKGNSSAKVYSTEYAKEYNDRLNNMAERKMRAAILAVGSFWYTAWVNAGQPDLDKIELKMSAEELKAAQKEEEKTLKKENLNFKEKGHIE